MTSSSSQDGKVRQSGDRNKNRWKRMGRNEFLHKDGEANNELDDKHTNRNSHWVLCRCCFFFFCEKWQSNKCTSWVNNNKIYTCKKFAIRKGKYTLKLIKENPLFRKPAQMHILI